MCGLVGIASTLPVTERSWLAAGRDAMSHRGPDDKGEWWSGDGRVGLGHRRLSIVDLSQAGHQPMQESALGLTVVFNGEIYNFIELRDELIQLGYSFRSQSDTEVLLAAYDAWGKDFLQRLNGMFSFALHDSKRNTILLARDRAGEKPLFYHYDQGVLRFGSELKGLLADSSLQRRINIDALDCYMAMGYVPGSRCILQDFQKLAPAHALSFELDSGSLTEWRFWSLPESPHTSQSCQETSHTLAAELEGLLENSIKRQLVADVPVGILLSGGVDSSLITAIAARSLNKIKTFTIAFPGSGALDESVHARLIADHFGTEHTELEALPTSVDILPKLAKQFDEPMIDSSMIPTYLVSQLVRQHCTVALGGDGGDELFGGYLHYNRLLWLQRRLGIVPLKLRRVVSNAAGRYIPLGVKGRNWLQGLGVDLEGGLPLIASYFDQQSRQKLLGSGKEMQAVAEAIRELCIPADSDLLQRATRMDFNNYLPEDILVKVDRSSMLNSLEIRAPFLDREVIEFAFGKVPSVFKTSIDNRKIILKHLAARLLPAEFNMHRKQGFSIPLAAWLQKGPWRDLFYDVLLDPQCIFERGAVSELLKGQDKGRSNSERLFGLVQFELWRREYAVSL